MLTEKHLIILSVIGKCSATLKTWKHTYVLKISFDT